MAVDVEVKGNSLIQDKVSHEILLANALAADSPGLFQHRANVDRAWVDVDTVGFDASSVKDVVDIMKKDFAADFGVMDKTSNFFDLKFF